jgi:Protein of unknown function (DUF3078)
MIKQLFVFALIMSCLTNHAFAQASADRLKEIQNAPKQEADGWIRGGAVGADFLQSSFLNPAPGGGVNFIGIGGVNAIYANYKAGKLIWSNSGTLQLGVQRLGKSETPWLKSIDRMYGNSNFAYKVSDDSKWAYAFDFAFLSQLTSSYRISVADPRVVLSKKGNEQLFSKFLSPATITFAPGMTYKHDSHLSVFLSPLTMKMDIVANDEIAALNIHGNPWRSKTDFDNVLTRVGASAKAVYNNKFFNDKIIYSGSLEVFSNYIKNPQNLVLDSRNSFGYAVTKNFSLNLTLDAFYDEVKRVQLSNDNNRIGRGTSVVQQFVAKYNYVF